MKKVASYSLFGKRPEAGGTTRDFYWDFVPALVRSHHNLFSDWELRIHVDSTKYEDRSKYLRAYEDAGLLVAKYVEENKSTCRSMLWRLLPIWEHDVSYVMCRDIDSSPTLKDRYATEEFVHSGCSLHCLNDNPAHTVPMMGGLVSFNALKFRALTPWRTWEELISTGSKYNLDNPSGGPDQNLQSNEIYPIFYSHDICCHRFSGMPIDPAIHHCYNAVSQHNLKDIPESVIANNFDSIIPHLGCAGYPASKVVEFFDTYGRKDITDKVKSIESYL
jgi:hypothetical protein